MSLYKNNFNFYLDNYAYQKLKSNSPNIYLAKFDKKMFEKINFAVIRPGLGTVTECLRYSIPIISINTNHNNFNSEIRHNSKVLENNKLGISLKNLKNLNKSIKQIEKIDRKHFFKMCRELRWNAEKIILNDTITKYQKIF